MARFINYQFMIRNLNQIETEFDSDQNLIIKSYSLRPPTSFQNYGFYLKPSHQLKNYLVWCQGRF